MILTRLHLHLVLTCVSSVYIDIRLTLDRCVQATSHPPLICAGPKKQQTTRTKVEERRIDEDASHP